MINKEKLKYWKEKNKNAEGEYKQLCLRQIKYFKELIKKENIK